MIRNRTQSVGLDCGVSSPSCRGAHQLKTTPPRASCKNRRHSNGPGIAKDRRSYWCGLQTKIGTVYGAAAGLARPWAVCVLNAVLILTHDLLEISERAEINRCGEIEEIVWAPGPLRSGDGRNRDMTGATTRERSPINCAHLQPPKSGRRLPEASLLIHTESVHRNYGAVLHVDDLLQEAGSRILNR